MEILVPTLNIRPFYNAYMIALINVGYVLMIMLQYVASTPVIRIFLNDRVPKIAGKIIPSNKQHLRSYFTGSFL